MCLHNFTQSATFSRYTLRPSPEEHSTHRRNSASLSAVQIDTAATWPVACTPRSVRPVATTVGGRCSLGSAEGQQREHGRLHSVRHRSHCGRRSTRGHGVVAPPCFLCLPPAERGAIVLQHQLDTTASGSTCGTQVDGRGAASPRQYRRRERFLLNGYQWCGVDVAGTLRATRRGQAAPRRPLRR